MDDKSTTNRRVVLKSASTAILGSTILAGQTSAASDDEEHAESSNDDLVVAIDTMTEDDTQYTISVCHDKTTGETDGFILPTAKDGEGSTQKDSEVSLSVGPDEEEQIYGVKPKVLESIEEFIKESSEKQKNRNDIQSTEKSTSGFEKESEPKLWDHIKSTHIGTRDRSIVEDIIDDLSDGAKEALNRIGGYYIESPQGTSCDASYNSNPHHQLGASMDYNDNVNSLSATLFGGVLGAIIGALLGGAVGGAIGAIVGGISTFVIDYLKDTSNATVVLRDYDSCTAGLCNPKVEPLVSGIWMDKEQDLLTIPSVDPPAIHLENGAAVDAGFEFEEDIY
ncbi:hypothetical protein SAMN05444422_104175 [Halobiforma haloterrestris]|uniref:Glycine zipper n=2 Tax=Natronobacterium haloterrestre TaxID=148448 RepID=A0A1I1GAJ3_NATHA|nr:hypothetical protein SAMN05444422_104175 [Halobiforma haloterrestris]